MVENLRYDSFLFNLDPSYPVITPLITSYLCQLLNQKKALGSPSLSEPKELVIVMFHDVLVLGLEAGLTLVSTLVGDGYSTTVCWDQCCSTIYPGTNDHTFCICFAKIGRMIENLSTIK